VLQVPKKYRTASTRLEAEEWENYKRLCADNGVTPFKELQQFIQGRLQPVKEEVEIERNTEGLEKGSQVDIPGGGGGSAEGVDAEAGWGDCPFC